MKKLILAFAALSLAVIMSSCSKSEVIDQNSDRTPLKFRVATGQTTKSNAGEINNMANRTITVFVNATAGNVIDAAGNPITQFYLITPGDLKPENMITTSDFAGTIPLTLYMTADAQVQFGALAGNDATGAQIDFVGEGFAFDGTSITKTGFASLPLKETVYAISGDILPNADPIQLLFKHTVSQVMFAVAQGDDDVTGNGEYLQISVSDVSVASVPVTGDLTATASGAVFANSVVGDYPMANMETTVAINMNSTTAEQDDNTTTRKAEFTSFFVLPWSISGPDATLSVTYKILGTTGSAITDDLTEEIPFSVFAGITSWTAGKRYTYIFKPGPLTTPVGTRITVTADTDEMPWADDGDDDIDVKDDASYEY